MNRPRLENADLFRQFRQHLESLKGAGIEWLPATSRALARESSPARQVERTSLFEDAAVTLTAAPSADERPLSDRRQALSVLAEKIASCVRCPELVASRRQTVFGVGQPGVDVCFVGEAPGADEDAQGEPFVGAAGQLLNRIIAACRMKREDVYICNILKCHPPGNRTPMTHECGNCRPFLEEQLDLVRPRFICALGSCAAQNLLNTTVSIGKLRGRFHDYRGIPVVVTYHPAFLLPHRSPHKKKDVWEDMKMLMARLGRPVD